MISVVILTTILIAAAAGEKQCSDADVTLVDYIKWQMNTARISTTQNNNNCKCKEIRSIAFNAKLSKTINSLAANSVVVFDTFTMNEGEGYNPKSGVFTCPLDGNYAFSWTICTKQKSVFHSDLVVDGKVFAYNYNNNNHGGDYKSASQAAVVTLKEGNKVWIKIENNAGFAYNIFTSFSGFRV